MHNPRNLRRKPYKPHPVTVVTTAIRVVLNKHRYGVLAADYSLLDGALRARDWKVLLSWADAQDPLPPDTDVFPADHAYLVRKQLVALFKKFAFLPSESGHDPEKKAVGAFSAAEHRCKRVNLKFRFLSRYRREVEDERRRRMLDILDIAASEILRVLGEKPDLQKIYGLCDFSGGASVGVHGNATNFGRKFLSEEWSVTPTCASYAFEALWYNNQMAFLGLNAAQHREVSVAYQEHCALPSIVSIDKSMFAGWFSSKLTFIQNNIISFVPKTAKTHRAIAVEPLLNGFVQKGIDSYMRGLLKASHFNIDLTDQTKNQRWAKWGSLEGVIDPLVTLDLSQASDSISLALVRRLLPPEWFVLLNATRSPSYSLNGVVKRYEKFCSMGNGFCFPLETLIFAAISAACYKICGQRPQLVVYGDDIIVRQNIALLVTEALQWVGFKVNRDKSFYHGPFRESCGADWVRGRMVTPVYIRKRADTLEGLVALHNSLVANGDDLCKEVAEALRSKVPIGLRYVELHRPTRVPSNTGFLVGMDEFMTSPHTVWVPELGSFLSREFSAVPVADDDLVHPLRRQVEYLAVLRGASSEQPLSLRRETKTRVTQVSYGCAYLRRAQQQKSISLKG